MQHTTLSQLNKADISKCISFSININLTEISRFIYIIYMLFLNSAYSRAFLFGLRVSALLNGL